MNSRLRRATLALAALLVLSVPGAAAATSTLAVPIPGDPLDPVVTPFTGTPATAQPYAPQSVPRTGGSLGGRLRIEDTR